MENVYNNRHPIVLSSFFVTLLFPFQLVSYLHSAMRFSTVIPFTLVLLAARAVSQTTLITSLGSSVSPLPSTHLSAYS